MCGKVEILSNMGDICSMQDLRKKDGRLFTTHYFANSNLIPFFTFGNGFSWRIFCNMVSFWIWLEVVRGYPDFTSTALPEFPLQVKFSESPPRE